MWTIWVPCIDLLLFSLLSPDECKMDQQYIIWIAKGAPLLEALCDWQWMIKRTYSLHFTRTQKSDPRSGMRASWEVMDWWLVINTNKLSFHNNSTCQSKHEAPITIVRWLQNGNDSCNQSCWSTWLLSSFSFWTWCEIVFSYEKCFLRSMVGPITSFACSRLLYVSIGSYDRRT